MSVRSLIATNSMLSLCMPARKTMRPMRPNPFIATRVMLVVLSLLAFNTALLLVRRVSKSVSWLCLCAYSSLVAWWCFHVSVSMPSVCTRLMRCMCAW